MLFEKKIIDIYKNIAFVRCDDNGTAYYFSSDDFEGLRNVPFSFQSSKGHMLQGYFYNYDNPIDGRIIVFDHGFGGGHRSYMKEIEMLCRKGYRVFAYDHTGCMESGGENTGGLSQSLCDLDDCMKALKEKCKDVSFSVIGHSWGGFSTMNITALHPEITHIIPISGFVSVERMVSSFFGGVLKGYCKCVMETENNSNPAYVNYDGVKTLSETASKVLLVYSDNDPMCKRADSYDVLKNALEGKENIKFLLETEKWHNPNYTKDAVMYKDDYVAKLNKMNKKKALATSESKKKFVAEFDWGRMTVQDEKVWNLISEFLES